MGINRYLRRIVSEGLARELEGKLGSLEQSIEEQQRLLRDLLILHGFRSQSRLRLRTAHPIALLSDDHQFPRGAARDNTHYPRFCHKCEQVLGAGLSVLDLGCAGGGLVWDFLIRGHFAVGLEGSDSPLRNQRAEWRLIPNYLFTCDITKPFTLAPIENESPWPFDVICAWEVLEHIPEPDLGQLFENVRRHLSPRGLFLASVATFEDSDRVTGAVWHVTVRERSWWFERLAASGFEVVDGVFEVADFPRGSGNGPHDWSALENPSRGFHIVAKLASHPTRP